MNERQTLHQIVERLPERDLITAFRLLKDLQLKDAQAVVPENAPADHGPFDPADLEGDDDERSISHEEVIRQFRK